MEEDKIVDIALESLEKYTFFQTKWLKETPPKDLDAVVTIRFGKDVLKLYVEVKNELRSRQLPQIEKLAREHENFMVIANHIYPKVKEELRKQDIAYLESNGNIFLHKDHVYFWVDHYNPTKINKDKTNRAFTKTGLKVVFHFLQFENDINLPYRTIAELTDTALGNVPNILNGLKEQGFLLKLNEKKYKLQNKKELLERWMTAYQQDLKPTLELGTFRFLKQEDFLNWRNIPLKSGKSWWGGEPAADLYTNYLKPEILTIYTLESRSELIKHYRLIPDPKGNVHVYQRFWKKDEVNDKMAPPLLIYADLMSTGDRRCIETAEKIYNELLQDKL